MIAAVVGRAGGVQNLTTAQHHRAVEDIRLRTSSTDIGICKHRPRSFAAKVGWPADSLNFNSEGRPALPRIRWPEGGAGGHHDDIATNPKKVACQAPGVEAATRVPAMTSHD